MGRAVYGPFSTCSIAAFSLMRVPSGRRCMLVADAHRTPFSAPIFDPIYYGWVVPPPVYPVCEHFDTPQRPLAIHLPTGLNLMFGLSPHVQYTSFAVCACLPELPSNETFSLPLLPHLRWQWRINVEPMVHPWRTALSYHSRSIRVPWGW